MFGCGLRTEFISGNEVFDVMSKVSLDDIFPCCDDVFILRGVYIWYVVLGPEWWSWRWRLWIDADQYGFVICEESREVFYIFDGVLFVKCQINTCASRSCYCCV